MKIEIVVPAILCVMAGIFVLMGYLFSSGRLGKRAAIGVSVVFAVFCLGFCGWIIRESGKGTVTTVKEQAVPAEYMQNAATISEAGKKYPKEAFHVLKGKRAALDKLYLAGKKEDGGNVYYVLSTVPGGTLDKGGNTVYFGRAVTKETTAKLESLSPLTPASFILEFVDMQEIGKDTGYPVTVFMVLVHNVFAE